MKQSLISFIFLLGINLVYCQEQKDFFEIARKGTVEEAVSYLKANPNALKLINDDGFSPLLLACYRSNNAVAKFLVDSGSDINQKSSMGTALMAATVKGNSTMVQYLLLKYANVNLTDENGTTALMYAVMFKNKEIVTMLLHNNADKSIVDNKGKSAFEYAVFSGNEDIINLLK